MAPLRTAATTAAFRRTTHLLVFGGGRPSVSCFLIRDSSEGVLIPLRGGINGPTSPVGGPSATGLVGRIAAFPLVSRSTGAIPFAQATPVFHVFLTISSVFVTNFLKTTPKFRYFPSLLINAEIAARRCSEQERTLLRDYATLMPQSSSLDGQSSISRVIHDEKKNFSRRVLALSENLALVNGAILLNVNRGGTR